MANLLVHLESFAWHDLHIDRAKQMDDLILAVDKAEEWSDAFYGHPDAYNPYLGWGSINDLLTYSEDEYRFFTNGWFTNNHQKILLKLWRNPTPGQARNLTELDLEEGFIGANNGLIGCQYESAPNKFVYNEASLVLLHQNFVQENPVLRETNPAYFYRHYEPTLRLPASQINDLIQRGQTHTCFLRLDTPSSDPKGHTLHGEQVGMHFNDKNKSCLYIDGTWKHGAFEIPREAKEMLEKWGFLLPKV